MMPSTFASRRHLGRGVPEVRRTSWLIPALALLYHTMKHIKSLLFAVLAVFVVFASHAALAQQPVKQYTIEQFMATTRIGGSSFSSDEKSILFHSNKSGIYNVYTMPVAGGDARQLTNSTTESTFAISYFPADARFLYHYDKGGNENDHI